MLMNLQKEEKTLVRTSSLKGTLQMVDVVSCSCNQVRANTKNLAGAAFVT